MPATSTNETTAISLEASSRVDHRARGTRRRVAVDMGEAEEDGDGRAGQSGEDERF